MPKDAAYRKYTEQLVNERFGHVKTVSVAANVDEPGFWGRLDLLTAFLRLQEPDVEKLEKKINGGQIEEVIFQVDPHLLAMKKE